MDSAQVYNRQLYTVLMFKHKAKKTYGGMYESPGILSLSINGRRMICLYLKSIYHRDQWAGDQISSKGHFYFEAKKQIRLDRH